MKCIVIPTAEENTPAHNATIDSPVARNNQVKFQIVTVIKGFNGGLVNPREPHIHFNPLYRRFPRAMLSTCDRHLFAAGNVVQARHSVNIERINAYVA